MKILVISLLRLGDFIQTAPVISGYKRKFPKARVDVLVHSQLDRLRPMLPMVDRWHFIDRDELQSGLGRARVPLLTPFAVLREQCDALADEKYDLIVNLTHTQFSGWIAGYIPAKNKMGLVFNSRGQAFFNSPWIRYLNQRADGAVMDILNYTDIFMEACELDRSTLSWPLTATAHGEKEADAVGVNGEIIVIQALTSDSKKNWGTEHWCQWTWEMMSRRPQSSIVLLGAPNEREALEQIRSGCGDSDRIHVAILSLDGALALLNRAKLLVTGDTSIKHLANAANCRVIEISLGSSDIRRTGIYKPDSLIVESGAFCSPCPHSAPCSQSSHICSQNVDPAVVSEAADLFMNDDWIGLSKFKNIKRTRILNTGFWFAEPLANLNPVSSMEVWLERSMQKFVLNGAEKNAIPTFGSEVYQLSEELARLIPGGGFSPLVAHLDFLEQELNVREVRSAEERGKFQPDGKQELIDLSELRAKQNYLENERREIEVKGKLIRSLRTRLAEFI